ncbi:MAG: sigma-70 family RNA polymerase sigma factor, partial [Lentisphaerae bacterium]
EEIAERIGQPAKRVRAWLKIQHQPVSFHSVSSEDSELTLIDQISDEDVENPSDSVGNDMLQKAIEDALSTLSEREQEIIRSRFGLNGRKVMTLEELSKQFGVSHERIRQIEANALKKLRSKQFRNIFGR